jgi:oleandomycin transport system permease protein
MTLSQLDRPVLAGGVPSRFQPSLLLRHSLAVARRNLVQMRSEPVELLATAVMPVLLSLIFIYVLGGAISHGQGDYKQYLLPGIMVQTATFAARSTGIGLNQDFATGMMDRFRSLPIARSSVLIGRILADVCRMALGQLVMFGYALIIGFRAHGGPAGVLAAMGVTLAFGFVICWVTAYIGVTVRGPQTMETIGFVWMIPLQFGSSMFVAAGTMPGWLRAFVQVNPVSLVCNASRALMQGTPATGPLLGTAAWLLVLTALFAPLSTRKFARRT